MFHGVFYMLNITCLECPYCLKGMKMYVLQRCWKIKKKNIMNWKAFRLYVTSCEIFLNLVWIKTYSLISHSFKNKLEIWVSYTHHIYIRKILFEIFTRTSKVSTNPVKQPFLNVKNYKNFPPVFTFICEYKLFNFISILTILLDSIVTHKGKSSRQNIRNSVLYY